MIPPEEELPPVDEANPPDPNLPPDAAPTPDPTGGEAAPVQEAAMTPGPGGIRDATPEQQDMADRMVTNAKEMIYEDRMFPRIVDMLDGGVGDGNEGDDPVQGLAMATELILTKVIQGATAEGLDIDPAVLIHSMCDILETLAEVSRQGKIKDYSEDPDALERALYSTGQLYIQHNEGDKESAAAELKKLVEMDQNGELEKLMRDLAANDEARQAGGPEIPENENEKPALPPNKGGLGNAIGGM